MRARRSSAWAQRGMSRRSRGRWNGPKSTLAGRARGCAAFRLAPLAPAPCAASSAAVRGAAIDAAAIACLVEKLSLTKAGREAGYGDLLRAAPRRAPCRTPLG